LYLPKILFTGRLESKLKYAILFLMKISAQKKIPTVKTLANEVSMLRSFLIGAIGKDDEGEYRPEFVENMLTSFARATPHHEFFGSGDFLRRIQRLAK